MSREMSSIELLDRTAQFLIDCGVTHLEKGSCTLDMQGTKNYYTLESSYCYTATKEDPILVQREYTIRRSGEFCSYDADNCTAWEADGVIIACHFLGIAEVLYSCCRGTKRYEEACMVYKLLSNPSYYEGWLTLTKKDPNGNQPFTPDRTLSAKDREYLDNYYKVNKISMPSISIDKPKKLYLRQGVNTIEFDVESVDINQDGDIVVTIPDNSVTWNVK